MTRATGGNSEYVLRQAKPFQDIERECAPPYSQMRHEWGVLCAEWPSAYRAIKAVSKYLGAQVVTTDGPILYRVIERALEGYINASRTHEYRRLQAFIMGCQHGVAALPAVTLRHKSATWRLGDAQPLPQWLKGKPRSRVQVYATGEITSRQTRLVLQYCLDPAALQWLTLNATTNAPQGLR